MIGSRLDIGIDLGTATVVASVKGKGIVLREPSVVAINKKGNEVLAVGTDARKMIGRTPSNIVAIRPLKDGVISDFTATSKMLKYFINKACSKNTLGGFRMMICVPSQITEVERRAVIDVAIGAGAKKAYLIEEPVAAAIGAGIDIAKPCGNLVVDIGGGTTDVAVISMAGSVVSASVKVAGDNFDQAIMSYVRKNHSLFIGEEAAENIKIKIGTACQEASPRMLEVKGRNVITGLPKVVTLTSEEIRIALRDAVNQIVETVHGVLEKTPPELAADIVDRGIVLTGGGALLHGMDTFIEQKTGVSTLTVQDAMSAVVVGTGKYAEVITRMEE